VVSTGSGCRLACDPFERLRHLCFAHGRRFDRPAEIGDRVGNLRLDAMLVLRLMTFAAAIRSNPGLALAATPVAPSATPSAPAATLLAVAILAAVLGARAVILARCFGGCVRLRHARPQGPRKSRR